ncbi:cytochrome c1 [Sphingorhabdus pulchriflava]|uniref:Cytochrome c1 n=1 Tax=Sphingorhabdus pulchriflava TaxID=2292257 RepID=A0A371BFP0_9SPHN|nr:cytochrome c1 [Sphingorhabdus pulchriflava]RDV06390.1 cytochrome c1 [Sphingorhabdus pulchriflava]
MVRLIAGLVGLFFSGMLLISLVTGAYTAVTEPVPPTVESQFHKHPKKVSFAHDGPFGAYDKAQLQRGLKVYAEVCAACHSLKLVAFRNFEEIGYSEDEVKAIAKGWKTEVPTINPETGEPATRPGLPADKIPSPFANETAARAANNNALPPDLSLMTKARHNGTAYVYSLLMGYADANTYKNEDGKSVPKEVRPGTGLHFNPYFANLNLAMAAPITGDDQVTYDDGTKATKDQMAKDVAAFLTWTAEPKMEARKTAGWAALIFLIIFTGLCYLSYRTIWADKKH